MRSKIWRLSLLLSLLAIGRLAADSVREYGAPVDTAVVEVRLLPNDALMPYLNDDVFLYDRQPTAMSFWQLLQLWLWQQVQKMGWEDTYPLLKKLALGALVCLGLWLLIRQLFGAHLRGLFYHDKSKPILQFADEEEHIESIDFGLRIQQAVAQEDYRSAVRLYYLRALQTLADQDLIYWKVDKTNQDYVRELGASPLRPSFAEITRHFEYIWYGDVSLEESAFGRTENFFHQFEREIAGRV